MACGAFIAAGAPVRARSDAGTRFLSSTFICRSIPLSAPSPALSLAQRNARVQPSSPVMTSAFASDIAAAAAASTTTAASFLHLAEVSSVNYSSLAVTAFVFFLTFWGSISFVKGSTKPRITQASFTIPVGPSAVAKTVTKYLSERGFVADPDADPRPGVVTFTGNVKASSSVSVLLVLVGASGLWASSLILNVLLPEALQSPNWGWISLLSVLVVPWYRGQAERTEQVLVLVEEDEPGAQSTLFLKGHRDEIIALENALGWVRNDPDDPVKSPAAIEKAAVPSITPDA
jgi:Cofactor assembly of complex C subunit B